MLAVQPYYERVFGEAGLGFRENLAESIVEAAHNLPGQFQVGNLVLPHRHCIGLIKDNIGGLQYGISHQSVLDGVFGFAHLADFVFEGRHPHEPAQGRYHGKQGAQGHDFRDVGLDEDNATLRIDTGGQPIQNHILDVRLDLRDVLRSFNRS